MNETDTAAALAVRAVRRLRASRGERAAIIGSGPLAELLRTALEEAGVEVVEGAVTPEGSPRDDVTLVLETTGDPNVIAGLLERAPRLARVALMGPTAGRVADVDFYRTVHQGGLEVIGLSETIPAAPEDVALARELLRRRGDADASGAGR
jgi:hypothetical protein